NISASSALSAPAMSRTAFGCKSVGVASGAIRSDLASRAVIGSLLPELSSEVQISSGISLRISVSQIHRLRSSNCKAEIWVSTRDLIELEQSASTRPIDHVVTD